MSLCDYCSDTQMDHRAITETDENGHRLTRWQPCPRCGHLSSYQHAYNVYQWHMTHKRGDKQWAERWLFWQRRDGTISQEEHDEIVQQIAVETQTFLQMRLI